MNSLRAKLLLPLLLISAAMAAYLYGVWMPRALDNSENAQLKEAVHHLDSVVEGLIPLLLGNELDIVYENLEAVQKTHPEWVAVRLSNAEGKKIYPLAASAAPAQGASRTDARTLEKRIGYLGMELGKLTVEVDMGPVLAATRTENQKLALVLAAILAAIVLTIALTLEIAVRRPVRQLADASKKLAGGDFATALPLAGHDEVGELVASFTKMRGDLHNYQASLVDSLEQTIGVLSRAIEARDPYTDGHQKRVSQLAVAIAEEMGLAEEMVTGIRLGSLVHDVGKIRVPADILNKPSKLSAVEFELVKGHPQAGHDILAGATFPWPVARMVLQHHERLDGSGYPDGLSGDAICLEARIIGVADVVESMTSHRPYRTAMKVEDAIDELRTNRGRRYDPQVVDCCIRVLEKKNYRVWD